MRYLLQTLFRLIKIKAGILCNSSLQKHYFTINKDKNRFSIKFRVQHHKPLGHPFQLQYSTITGNNWLDWYNWYYMKIVTKCFLLSRNKFDWMYSVSPIYCQVWDSVKLTWVLQVKLCSECWFKNWAFFIHFWYSRYFPVVVPGCNNRPFTFYSFGEKRKISKRTAYKLEPGRWALPGSLVFMNPKLLLYCWEILTNIPSVFARLPIMLWRYRGSTRW